MTKWRRGRDSNPRADYSARRFRGAPVTTTSVPLLIYFGRWSLFSFSTSLRARGHRFAVVPSSPHLRAPPIASRQSSVVNPLICSLQSAVANELRLPSFLEEALNHIAAFFFEHAAGHLEAVIE